MKLWTGLKWNMIGCDGGDESFKFHTFSVTQEKAHWNFCWNNPSNDIKCIIKLGNKDRFSQQCQRFKSSGIWHCQIIKLLMFQKSLLPPEGPTKHSWIFWTLRMEAESSSIMKPFTYWLKSSLQSYIIRDMFIRLNIR